MKEEHKGIKSISLNFFNDENKNVRELNQISYRMLSFIFFSYLFYAKILGYIDDNNINENLFPFNSGSLYNVILQSWKFLENALKSKGINEIQIFLHLIYPKLIEILKSIPKIERIDYKLILFNLQSLFLYFTNKRNILGDEVLIDEINQLPKKIVKLDDDFINIFQHPHLKLD